MTRKAFDLSEALRAILILAVAVIFGTLGWTQFVNAQGAQGAPGGGQGQGQGAPGGGQGRGGRGGGGGGARGGAGGGAQGADLHTLKVQGNVYMIVGGGANITVQVGSDVPNIDKTGADGVTLVNAGTADMGDAVLAQIRAITDLPIRNIIYTNDSPDNVGGAATLATSGNTIAGGNVGAQAPRGATIISLLGVLDRMSPPTGQTAPFPPTTWPTDTFEGPVKNYFINGEAIQLFHPDAAITNGDLMAFFRRSDVLSTGDVFVTTGYPVIDSTRGGSFPGVLAALNQILDVAIPREKQEGGTYIIPGHGRLCDIGDAVYYQEMLTIIRDRVQDSIKHGMTLDQVKAAKFSRDYDPEYGSSTGPWTTDMFIEAVYKGLSAKK